MAVCRDDGHASSVHSSSSSAAVSKSINGLVVVDPQREREFLHHLPVELMWGVGPVTRARLAQEGVLTIGQLAERSPRSLERVLGRAAADKLTALAWNRDPREIKTHRRARSAGAQSAIGREPS